MQYSIRLLAVNHLNAFILIAIASSNTLAEPTADITDVRIIDRVDPTGPFDRVWQPFIAKWSEKHLIATSCLDLRGKFDMGDVVCLVSTDAGKTWSPRIPIFDHRQRNGTVQYAYNNAVLFREPGQDILWCFAMRAPIQYRDSEDAYLCAAYTADGGYSWTHVELAMDYHGPLITNAGIVPFTDDSGTRYLLGVHRNTLRHDRGGDRQQFVLESRNLLRWKLAAYVPNNATTPVWLHEGNIAPGDSAGELKMVMRTAGLERGDPLPGSRILRSPEMEAEHGRPVSLNPTSPIFDRRATSVETASFVISMCIAIHPNERHSITK